MSDTVKILFLFAVTLLAICLSGFVFLKFYEWFLLSTFNLPEISYIHGLGIVYFYDYLSMRSRSLSKERISSLKNGNSLSELKSLSYREKLNMVLIRLFSILSYLGIGYLIYLFI